jgi:hypothetical protein
MDFLFKLAKEQAGPLLVAIGVVTYVEPTTRAGAILLGAVVFALLNVIVQFAKFAWKQIRPTPPAPPPANP